MPNVLRTYQVRLLRYGFQTKGQWYPARWLTWSVSAASRDDALKRAKRRFPRAEPQLQKRRVLTPD